MCICSILPSSSPFSILSLPLPSSYWYPRQSPMYIHITVIIINIIILSLWSTNEWEHVIVGLIFCVWWSFGITNIVVYQHLWWLHTRTKLAKKGGLMHTRCAYQMPVGLLCSYFCAIHIIQQQIVQNVIFASKYV
jgi:hypothetical protein